MILTFSFVNLYSFVSSVIFIQEKQDNDEWHLFSHNKDGKKHLIWHDPKSSHPVSFSFFERSC